MADSNHETADASGTPRPLRSILLEALQAVAGDCEALRSIDGGPRGKGNLAQDPGEWALIWLRDFWPHWDEAQGILDHIPPDALHNLQSLAGRPWKLATRQTLDEIAKPIQATRPWFDLNPDPAMQKADRRAMLASWETADFSTWPALLADLSKLTANLWTIRAERYAAPGADPRGGAVDALQPQDAPQDLQAGPVGKGQDAAAGGDGDDQAYRELAKWAKRNLGGKEFRLVDAIISAGGWLSLPDCRLACDWLGDEYKSTMQRVNKKFRANKQGWLLRQSATGHDETGLTLQPLGRRAK